MRRLLLSFIFIYSTIVQSQTWQSGNYHHPWVDSTLAKLSLKEQIAQMMMVGAYSNKGPEHTIEVEEMILKHKVGGLIFFQGTPLKQAYLTNYYQEMSGIPLMIGIDGEWGLAMRLQGVNKFPFQMTLGAARSDSLSYQTGYEMGKQCKQMGIHINFAPDVDVNTNPDNPIIGFRSFGENPKQVERNGAMIMQGMQDAGIMACAKHFPGHGDSRGDSHLELPYIEHGLARLEEVELYPFEQLIKKGAMSVMVAHLEIPALDTVRHRPSSLSPIVVTELLKKEMGFQGLVIIDALNMKAVGKYYGAGYAEAAAIIAGNDILLCPENVAKAIDIIVEEVDFGTIDSTTIAERVRKILYFKMLAGLHQYKHINTSDLQIDKSNAAALQLSRQTAEKCITVVTDKNELLPLPKHTLQKTAVWAIGKNGNYSFGNEVAKYQNADCFFTHRDSGYEVFGKMSDSLARNYDKIIIGIHDQNLWGKKSQTLPQQVIQNIYYLTENKPAIVVIFGNIYVLRNLPNLPCAIVAYEDGDAYQKATADIIYGIKPSLGRLPATAYNKGYLMDQGVSTESRMPTKYKKEGPIEAGFRSDFTTELNQLLEEATKLQATPGGQLLVLKNGKTVYQNEWGSFYYDSARPVVETDMYDVASITKVAATTLAAMKLYELGEVRLDAPIYNYLPDLKGTNKEKLTLRQLLLHEAGLPPFLPFYKDAMATPGAYTTQKDSVHNIRIADSFWITAEYKKTIWESIKKCTVVKRADFKYSDLSAIIIGEIVERVSGLNVAEFADKYFYAPMHLQRTLFNPTSVYSASEIAPTTEDHYFRNERVQGTVHDPSAAMLGGVAGNAGLFSNSLELGVIFQMLLNDGSYGGKQYLKPTTVKEFTKTGHKKTHRALGFDKPNGQPGEKANISEMVPLSLFGHTGFTGDWAWADPENKIVFIFLSNRTYPDENNKKLITQNIRTRAIEIVYKSLK